jgi:hypothetical protein
MTSKMDDFDPTRQKETRVRLFAFLPVWCPVSMELLLDKKKGHPSIVHGYRTIPTQQTAVWGCLTRPSSTTSQWRNQFEMFKVGGGPAIDWKIIIKKRSWCIPAPFQEIENNFFFSILDHPFLWTEERSSRACPLVSFIFDLFFNSLCVYCVASHSFSPPPPWTFFLLLPLL